MSAPGLGGVKTQASAARVEYLEGIARRESQIMLRPSGATPGWRIVFFTFRRCMSFHTGSVKMRKSHSEHILDRCTPESGRSFERGDTAASCHSTKSLRDSPLRG